MDITEILIKAAALVILVIWLISGVGYLLPGTTLQVAWMYGLFFGLLFMAMSTWVVKTMLLFFCDLSPKFKIFLDKFWEIKD